MQIIRDTQGGGGGGGKAMCHMNFFDVLNSDFKDFGSKKSYLRDQNKALKDTFFPIDFIFQILILIL